jgi:hypothetical protein
MILLWASLSGKVCDTILMKKSRPYLLLSPVGIDASMSCARSVVRQFLSSFLNSVVCKAARLVTQDRLFLHQRVCSLTYLSCCHVVREIKVSFKEVKWFGVSTRGLIVCDVFVPAYGWIFGFR